MQIYIVILTMVIFRCGSTQFLFFLTVLFSALFVQQTQTVQYSFKIKTPLIIRTTCWGFSIANYDVLIYATEITDKVTMIFSTSFPLKNHGIVLNGGKQANTSTKIRQSVTNKSKQTPGTKHLEAFNYTKTNLQFKRSDVEGGCGYKKEWGINGHGGKLNKEDVKGNKMKSLGNC